MESPHDSRQTPPTSIDAFIDDEPLLNRSFTPFHCLLQLCWLSVAADVNVNPNHGHRDIERLTCRRHAAHAELRFDECQLDEFSGARRGCPTMPAQFNRADPSTRTVDRLYRTSPPRPGLSADCKGGRCCRIVRCGSSWRPFRLSPTSHALSGPDATQGPITSLGAPPCLPLILAILVDEPGQNGPAGETASHQNDSRPRYHSRYRRGHPAGRQNGWSLVVR